MFQQYILQLGVAVGFLLPPMIVSGNEATLSRDLYILFISNGVFTSVLLVLIVFCKYPISLLLLRHFLFEKMFLFMFLEYFWVYFKLLFFKVFYILFLSIICTVFRAAPPTPPSLAAAQANEEEHIDFLQSIKRLCLNSSYMLLLNAYGINVGIFYAISTLLNQIILQYYPVSCANYYSSTKQLTNFNLVVINFETSN